MNFKILAFCSFIIILLIACNSNKQQCKAKIIERKQTTDSMLLISYQFLINDQYILDSVKTNNKLIQADSIIVEFNTNSPLQHKAIIP